MANFSLYSISAFLALDTEGNRVLAKYYSRPKDAGGPDSKFAAVKEQKSFEKGLWEKTKKPGGDVILFDSHLVLFKHSLDLIFYIIGPATENELMLATALNAFSDALSMLLRNQVEKRSVLENLDMVLLCLDETIDDGIIIETDSTAIASRVSRPQASSGPEIMLNEQAVAAAVGTVKEGLRRAFAQF